MADTKTLNKEEMQAFYDRLSELTQHGTEKEVRAYVNDHYPHLPQEVQDDILFSLMRTSIDEQILEEKTIDQIQAEGIGAAETLEELKAQMEADIQKREQAGQA